MNTKAWLQFSAVVNEITTGRFLNTLTNLHNSGTTELNILLSTPGGSILHGVTVYNFLRSLPSKITIYNTGRVDSIGTIIFLASDNRISTPNAAFLIHGVSLGFQTNLNLEEKQLRERMESIRKDRENIANIYAERTKIDLSTIENMMITGTTLNAAEAVSKRIATDIGIPQIGEGEMLLTVSDVI